MTNISDVSRNKSARFIAFYLPQFHPIPENDEWWGKGFTEWTNTAKARPLIVGHHQPNIPADLGFYDLRLPEARAAQAELAAAYGIEGFCYWHYWFDGRRLLERPFNEVLQSGEPDFPFCLGWANDSWSGIWHGCPDRVLMEQTYPGPEDEERHFNALLPAFSDHRYTTVDGKPLFLVYKPYRLPEPKRFIDHWQEMAIKAGLKGIYFVANVNSMEWPAHDLGFDALVPHNPGVTTYHFFNRNPSFVDRFCHKITGKTFKQFLRQITPKVDIMSYEEYIKRALPELNKNFDAFPCVVPNWDNTPRCGTSGNLLQGSTPELFKRHLESAVQQVADRPFDKRLIFVKSWNEWAEGNYLEPDLRFGRKYLEACREVVKPNA